MYFQLIYGNKKANCMNHLSCTAYRPVFEEFNTASGAIPLRNIIMTLKNLL